MKIKNFVNASIVTLASLSGAIASLELLIPQTPAFARDSFEDCRQALRDEGISEQQARRMCSYQDDSYWNDDDNDDRYNRDRYNRDRYDRNIYNRNDDNWNYDDDRDRYSNRRGRIRYIELRARSGRTSEGRWRYYAPQNVSYDAMQKAGCEHITGNDWRCYRPKIRVYVREQSRQNPRRWDRGVYKR